MPIRSPGGWAIGTALGSNVKRVSWSIGRSRSNSRREATRIREYVLGSIAAEHSATREGVRVRSVSRVRRHQHTGNQRRSSQGARCRPERTRRSEDRDPATVDGRTGEPDSNERRNRQHPVDRQQRKPSATSNNDHEEPTDGGRAGRPTLGKRLGKTHHRCPTEATGAVVASVLVGPYGAT